MADQLLAVADDFWNLRGSFKLAKVIDLGTHASLVRRRSGRFVLLDAYTLSGEVEREVLALTEQGEAVEAILNLHPFHTVHVARMHARFPRARLYGTSRHVAKAPSLPWEALRTDDPALHEVFSEDLDFSVPRGVDLVSANENVHFSSVLAFHRASGTIHVDDTLNFLRLPRFAGLFGVTDLLRFHPTLSNALERRAGAARDFRDWATETAERWREARNLCAAHRGTLLAADNGGASIHDRILDALRRVASTLAAHERRHG